MITIRIAGLDEAGRGPVIGSLFIGGVAVDDDAKEQLDALPLKDSKKLSDKQRRELEPQIRSIAGGTVVREVTASEIDELRKLMSLNKIELRGFAEVITRLDPDKAIIDLPEPDAERFSRTLKEELDDSFGDLAITAEHGADDTFPIVSAASILAKNAREDHIGELHEKYRTDFASGYPHDTPTIDFLEAYLDEHGSLPDETRLSWSTAQRIQKEVEQSSVTSFGDD